MRPKLFVALLCIFVLGMGVWLLKSNVYDTLVDAHAHQPVSFEEKPLFMAPAFVVFGLAGLIALPFMKLPQAAKKTGKPSTKHQIIGFAIVAVFGLVGYGLRTWLIGQLTELGYAPSSDSGVLHRVR